MSFASLAVIAALGASGLTVTGSLGVVALQERVRRKTADRRALADAVTQMLSLSMAVSLRAQAMGDTMKIRSGLGEGVDILTHQRKPTDPLEMHDWMAQDMAPLNAAWSVIWTLGDQVLIRRGNALLIACSDLLSVSTARMPAESTNARIRRRVVGERWTPEMQDALGKARVDMARSREQLARYARQYFGKPAAQLFGHESEPGEHPEAPQGEAAPDAPPPADVQPVPEQS